MFNRTIFQTKKIVTKNENCWTLEINLIFNGHEFSLTDSAICIDYSDAPRLVPGLDPNTAHLGDTFSDIMDVDSKYQFQNNFGTVLTDDATELLCDVYSGRSWNLRVMDGAGNVETCGSILSDKFMDAAIPTITTRSPCWIELSYSETSLDEDWTVAYGEPRLVFSNMHDGFAPMNVGDVISTIKRFGNVSKFSNKEEFVGSVTRQGNSLVLKVTDQCRRMGIDVGDEVEVTMSRDSPERNTTLRAFHAKNWTPINDPDTICHRNGCDLEKVRKFLDDFKVIGTVNGGTFKLSWPSSPYCTIFDHCSFFKTESGENIIISQPYSKGPMLKDAQEWARMNGCIAEEHREYSWHYPPDTTLLVFRIRENPEWRLPGSGEQRSKD